MTDRIKAVISLTSFVLIFIFIWVAPVHQIMTIKDWMLLIILEIPLQLGIHYLTGRKC